MKVAHYDQSATLVFPRNITYLTPRAGLKPQFRHWKQHSAALMIRSGQSVGQRQPISGGLSSSSTLMFSEGQVYLNVPCRKTPASSAWMASCALLSISLDGLVSSRLIKGAKIRQEHFTALNTVSSRQRTFTRFPC